MKIEDFIKEKLREEILKISKINTSGNSIYKVTTNKNEYILRLCGTKKRYRSKKEIISEIELINFLKSKNIPTLIPIKIDGSAVISLENKNGIFYKIIKGKEVENPNIEQCYSVGKLLGEMHTITTNYEFPHKRKKWGLTQTIKKFEEIKDLLLKDKYLEKHNFNERVEFVLDKINFNEDLPKGAIHEDLGKRHVLFENNKIKGILDWDRSYSNFFILDLGQTIRGWCFNNWKELNSDKFKSLLNGYETQRKLSNIEKSFLLNAIKFAFIERIIAFIVFSYNTKRKEYKEYAINDINLIEKLSINLD